MIIKLYLENFFIAQLTFLNIKPKKCFNITINKDCTIFALFVLFGCCHECTYGSCVFFLN